MAKKIKAKAQGKYYGGILNIDSKTAQEAGLLTILGAAAAGIIYGGYNLLKNIFYALPNISTSQAFAITGYRVENDGGINLLGHCANRLKDQPQKQENYELILDDNFKPEENELDDKEINKYFANLYRELDKSLKDIITDKDKRERAVMIGAQEGLWILSNEESLDNCRKALEKLNLDSILENELILMIFEAIYNAGVNLYALNASRDFFNIHFTEEFYQNKLKKLKEQCFNVIPIIGKKTWEKKFGYL